MASNQRENARRSKKRRNEQKVQRIIWCVIIIVALLLLIMKLAEIDFATLKDKFIDENGNFRIALFADDSVYPYSLDTSKNVVENVQNNKLNILTDLSCTILNPKDAKVLYSFNHGYANPEIKTAGNYFCIYDQGANRFRLDNLKKNIYENVNDNAVLAANVCKNGTVIYAAKSTRCKSTLTVINSSFKKLLDLSVNAGYITSVAIDASGKKYAYAAVNSRNARLVTTVYTINSGDKSERCAFEFEGSDVLDLKYRGSDLYIVGSDFVYTVTSQKNAHEVYPQGSVSTVCYGYTKDDELIYVGADYADASECHLDYINTSGKIKTDIQLTKKPKAVSSGSNEICVLFADSITVYSLTGGEEKKTYKCDESVSSVIKLGSKLFVCRNQLLDVIE